MNPQFLELFMSSDIFFFIIFATNLKKLPWNLSLFETSVLGKIIQRFKLISEMYFVAVYLISCFLYISDNQYIKTIIILNTFQLKSKLVFQLD